MTTPFDALLDILDCPSCRVNAGLVPQRFEGDDFLACRQCETWYPIKDEVIVLMPPGRTPGSRRARVEAATALSLEQLPARALDMKAVVYAFYATMSELCGRFDIGAEPLVADFGCSTGSFSAMLGAGQVYVGFDLSFRSLAFARRATGRFYVQADAECLPVKSRSVPFGAFDGCTCRRA
jgi:uncharacterized protein YbaR (Trm112 family)